MKIFRPEEKRENRLYLTVWLGVIVFLALRVVLECIIRGESGIDFQAILASWEWLLPFLLIFVVHNYFIAPLLIYRKQTALYTVFTFLLLALFLVWIFVIDIGPGPGSIPPEPDGSIYSGEAPGPPPDAIHGGRPMHPTTLRALVGLLLLVANIGIKVLFHSEKERDDLRELEKENLRHQLEGLRYQINPHFFMNTLNNIHALVDIDPEKAKESIVELSKLMRHVLYDSDKATIPLSNELDYLDHYVSLMRMRFPENVLIDYTRPDNVEGAEVPPLTFASFVENAFKHGLSYEKDSFVRFRVLLENGKIIFRCENSRAADRQTPGKGLGLENTRQRFNLLYGEDYTLHIDEGEKVYEVLLVLPDKPIRVI
ncbi:MAG: histidine kinase [Bacteroidales bacterium]|nr:histidine kinase [Bacteroidales bacterium]